MLTLGIETSCDETACALVKDGTVVLAQRLRSQSEHEAYGGVVPEVASRSHLQHVLPLLRGLYQEAGISPAQVDLVAVTAGPGLVGSLMVGVSFAKSYAYAVGRPVIGVNHLLGHLYANFLVHEPRFPAVALLVSGGHTNLILVEGHGAFRVLGRTLDDAAGEAFDKVARILGLGYPGGPRIERLAAEGDPRRVALPRLRLEHPLNFSFSGLKTALWQAHATGVHAPADLAAAFQQVVVEELVERTLRAAAEVEGADIWLAGGVAANGPLRRAMAEGAGRLGRRLLAPPAAYCTDNAAMIASAGTFLYRQRGPDGWDLGAQAAVAPFR